MGGHCAGSWVVSVGPVAAYSSLCGSLVVYLPGLLFTLLVARKMGADSASFLGTAAVAEFGKLLLTGVVVRPGFYLGKAAGADVVFCRHADGPDYQLDRTGQGNTLRIRTA